MVQIGLRVQPVGLGGLQNGEHNHAGVCAGLGITEQPVLPTDDNRADGVLYLVVADFNLAVVKERAKVLPPVQGVGDSLLQLACRAEDGLKPGMVFVDNGLREELPSSVPLHQFPSHVPPPCTENSREFSGWIWVHYPTELMPIRGAEY